MLLPIDSGDKSIAGHLICLIIATINQPEISLINHSDEISGLPFDGIWRPDRSLRLETGCIIGRENGPPVRAISIHHNDAVTARFALFRERGL